MKQKLIVTHISPDLDAITSIWLFKTFAQRDWGEAGFYFVPAGRRIEQRELDKLGVDSEDVEHVDTGLGRFDHHSEDKASRKISAASLVRDYLVGRFADLRKDRALERLVDHVVEIDHFGELYWPEPKADRYLFHLTEILGKLKSLGKSDEEIVEYGMLSLDSVYAVLKSRVEAEEELGKGREFRTAWGRGLALLSSNPEASKLAQKSGYQVVVRKDPEYGHVRIKAVPGEGIDLTGICEKIAEKDGAATWYLHPAKTMLLNGSDKARDQVASSLSLDEIVDVFRETIS